MESPAPSNISVTGTNGDDVLTGTSGPDTLDGASGNDTLVGAGGDDRLIGGSGNDTFHVDSGGDEVVEAAGEGNDRVAASASYALAPGVEVELLEAVTLGATNALDLAGNEFANTIHGNNGANRLDGGAGNDILFGFGGNDVLIGGAGSDSMHGGAGNDTFYVDSAGDVVIEAAGEGSDRVAASVSFALAAGAEVELLEAVTLTDTDALDLTGSDFANTLSGNNGANRLDGDAGNDILFGYGGNDVLIGGAGNDAMAGGLGNDTYYVDSAADTVTELGGEGGDRVATSVSYTLAAGGEVELLEAVTIGSTDGLDLTGSDTANVIAGNNGANTLNGRGGNDRLTGYGGADLFVFDSVLGAGDIDQIEDFAPATDRIVLAGAAGQPFAALASGSVAARSFVIGSAAADADDYLIYNQATGALLYDADGSGGGAAIQFATLQAGLSLTAADFLVSGAANNVPVISSGSSASIAENSSTSTIVYQATATDPDGDTINWSLAGPDAGRFTIDTSGAVRLISPADFETQSSYTFSVVASDSGPNDALKQVTLTITDVAEGGGPTPIIAEKSSDNNSVGTAQPIDRNVLSSSDNPDLFNDDFPSITIQGSVSPATDVDFFSISLEAGELLLLDIDGATGGLDTVVRVYDSSGNEIGFVDDSPIDPGSAQHPNGEGATLDSFVRFRALSSGTFYFSVESWGPDFEESSGTGTSSGSYSLHVSIGPKATPAELLEEDIQALISGASWPGTSLTYSFPTLASHYPAGTSETEQGFSGFASAQQQAVNQQLQMISQVTNLTFQQLAPGPANLRYANSTEPEVAYAYYPGSSLGGTAWFNNTDGRFANPVIGNYSWMGILHETGHALGLKHGHELPAISFSRDSLEYTVMTYRSYPGKSLSTGYSNETWGYPQSLMMLDIAALQRMYGANFTYNAGDTIYTWSPTTGQMFVNGVGQAAPDGNRVFMTIWDGGGNDTYDLSNYSTSLSTPSLTIDLRPGEWSTFSNAQIANLGGGHMARGNVANALLVGGDTRSLIENAIGSAGADLIIANQAANRLTGNGDGDTFRWVSSGDAGIGALADRITDFLRGTDRIDLSQIDARPGTETNDAFAFIGTSAFSNTAGELRYQAEGNSVRIQADLDGNGIADMEILVDNTTILAAGDFFL